MNLTWMTLPAGGGMPLVVVALAPSLKPSSDVRVSSTRHGASGPKSNQNIVCLLLCLDRTSAYAR